MAHSALNCKSMTQCALAIVTALKWLKSKSSLKTLQLMDYPKASMWLLSYMIRCTSMTMNSMSIQSSNP